MDTNMETNAELPKSVIQQRQATLQEISGVIDAASRSIDKVLKEIGWRIEDIQDKESLVQCPIYPQHRVADSSLQHHIERCKWARDGYTKEEQEESQSLEANKFFYENNKEVHTVELDAQCQRELLSSFPGTPSRKFPRTMSRLDAEFTPAERLAIYEKMREKSQSKADQLDLDLGLEIKTEKQDEEDKKVKTHAEIMAEMRDYRRRRQSYRAKNVHITKKSKTDVMREIIEAHMKFLEDTHSPAKEGNDDRKWESTHSRSREGSSTSSRDTNDQHRRYRSRSRDRSSRRGDRSRSGSRSRDRHSRRGDRSRSGSRSRDRSSRRGDRSRSSSRTRDGGSRHHKKHRHHSKHKHRHRSPTGEEYHD